MHYYNSKGEPTYTIIGRNGKARAPYKKEAKELNLAPGVTSINGQISSEFLSQWRINKTIDICLNNPFCEMGTSKEDWIKKIKNKIKIENDRITGQGHAIHNALERYYKTGKISRTYEEFIVPVIDLISEKWPYLCRTDWIAEASFNYKGFYGGKVDLHYPGCYRIVGNVKEYSQLPIILDFKTKDNVDIDKFKAYDSHKQQLIAYAYGLNIPESQCGNIFLSALKPNILLAEIHDEIGGYWDKFKLLLQYWHLENYKQKIEV